MKKLRLKRIILLLLCIIISSTIFIFSNQNGQKSESISDAFAEKVIDKVGDIKGTTYSEAKKKEIIKSTRFTVRKLAHFSVYFVLGILVYLLLICYNISNPIKTTIIVCFIYACTDEFHQIFSSGRTARLLDVFIDTFGCAIGTLLTYFIQTKLFKKDRVKIDA